MKLEIDYKKNNTETLQKAVIIVSYSPKIVLERGANIEKSLFLTYKNIMSIMLKGITLTT